MAGPQRLLYRPDACVIAPHVSARAVRGELRLRAEADVTGRTVLAQRHAAGAFHLSKPYWDGHALMVQWINPTAGVFAGDVLESEVTVAEQAALLVTTPSATRIHTRMDPSAPAGEQRQHFNVETGGWLEVQPEWLIPQRGSAFLQRTSVNVAAGGRLFYGELVAPGRVAHQESLAFQELDLRLKLYVAGRLIVQERLHALSPDRLWMMRSRDGRALFTGTVLLVLPGLAAAALMVLRQVLALQSGCASGASAVTDDVVVVRIAAEQGMLLRQTVRALRTALIPLCEPLRCDPRKL